MLSRRNGQRELRAPSGKADVPAHGGSASTLTTQTSGAIPPPAWPASGNVLTFLRCLRLLDLGLQDDWPGGTELLFAAKTSQQSLQQRVKFVEWSLYRLFELWDPAYARDKLSPFFPSLAPLQSLNLRAALFRGLTELKKNCVLGKEATLRKTMLDECKGDRFEEIIRTFAMVVLRKKAQMKFGKEPGFADLFAGRGSLSEEQYARMPPLILAHTQKLHRLVSQRKQTEKGLREQRSCLKEKEAALGQWEQSVVGEAKSLPDLKPGETDLYRNALAASWTGDEKWIELLLHGGSHLSSNPDLEASLAATCGDSSKSSHNKDSEPAAQLLIVNLSNRIAQQQLRLKKWTEFRDRLAQPSSRDSDNTSIRPLTQLINFDDHQNLVVPSGEKNLQQDTQLLRPEDLELVSAMQSELAKLRTRGGKKPASHQTPTLDDQDVASIPGERHLSIHSVDKMSLDLDPPQNAPEQGIVDRTAGPSTPPGKSQDDPRPSRPPSFPDIPDSHNRLPTSLINRSLTQSSFPSTTNGLPGVLGRTEKSKILLPPFSETQNDNPAASNESNNGYDTFEGKTQQSSPFSERKMASSSSARSDSAEHLTSLTLHQRKIDLCPALPSVGSITGPSVIRTPSPTRSHIPPLSQNRQLTSSTSPSRARKQRFIPSTPSKVDSQPVFRPKTPATPVELNLDTTDYASVFKSRPRVAVSPPPSPSPPRMQDRQTQEEDGGESSDEDVGAVSNLRTSPIRGWG